MVFDLILLVWLHFLADFVLQSDQMAKSKSKDTFWLLAHVSIYSLPFYWFGPVFALVNGAIHFFVDYFTSRVANYFYLRNERHWFFVTIGLDQALHLSSLILTYFWIVNVHI